jgi:hypothetical protein
MAAREVMSENDHVWRFIEALSSPGTELRTYIHAVGSVWDETTWDDASKAAILDALANSALAGAVHDQRARIAELEAALREMVLSVPGGSICDPQEVADTLRTIAERVGVRTE